jgi:hypothetical protein
MTLIISELGLVYFFGRTEARNAVAVYFHQPRRKSREAKFLHRERVHLLEHFLL